MTELLSFCGLRTFVLHCNQLFDNQKNVNLWMRDLVLMASAEAEIYP